MNQASPPPGRVVPPGVEGELPPQEGDELQVVLGAGGARGQSPYSYTP